MREVREEAGFNPSVADIGMPLWHRCTLTRSWNDPRKHILRKLTTQPDLVPELRGKGLGGKLVATLESLLTARGCPKLSLQLRAGVKRTSMIRAGDDFMFGVAEPYEMYERLCIITGCRQNPCALDVLISLTRFMGGDEPRPGGHVQQSAKIRCKGGAPEQALHRTPTAALNVTFGRI